MNAEMVHEFQILLHPVLQAFYVFFFNKYMYFALRISGSRDPFWAAHPLES